MESKLLFGLCVGSKKKFDPLILFRLENREGKMKTLIAWKEGRRGLGFYVQAEQYTNTPASNYTHKHSHRSLMQSYSPGFINVFYFFSALLPRWPLSYIS